MSVSPSPSGPQSSQPTYYQPDYMGTLVPPLVSFESPTYPVRQLLHRRRGRWHLVFGRAYGMAVSRWIGSLNEDTPATVSIGRRFWFRSWGDVVKLENLLNAEPSVIKLTGLKRQEGDVEIPQVEVLLPEAGLAQRCVYCGAWEDEMIDRRWYKVGEDHGDGVFWCGYCTRTSDIWLALSSLWDKGDLDVRYFGYRG